MWLREIEVKASADMLSKSLSRETYLANKAQLDALARKLARVRAGAKKRKQKGNH